MAHLYDLIIIGSGPAGLGAAIYAQRARLDTLVIEKAMVSGGQVLTTYEVDNYPGLPGISGYDLGLKLREHADKLGAQFAEDEVERVEDGGPGAPKRVICAGETYEARALILATGAVHRKLGIPGEEEFAGMGVSYCATCDGAFFRNKTAAVIGGGDVAVEDAIFLARMCSKVYLIHRRDALRAAKSLQESLMALDNEIERRQLLVHRYGAHDILDYQARRRSNPDMEEMPFLILVIDEFADFKAQYPDFTGSLNHIFRGGRALGIYTVIMTQKPAGVVTEQMTANANFRWCLKVMSESDSREMLGINDAAYLNKPGRSYVKIGTGVPELVQPFYSGAPYYPDGKRRKPAPAVARVSLNGERQPVAGFPQKSAGPAKGTQLQAVVQAIASYCRQNGIAPARQVWTEPLPEKLDLSRLLPGGRLWDKAADWAESPQSPTAYLGLTDDPANQCQTVAVHRFWTDGHLLAYGMPLSGKTTFLQTLLVSLCSCYTPGQVQLYLSLSWADSGCGAWKNSPMWAARPGMRSRRSSERFWTCF